MASNNVAQFATELKMPADLLLKQLKDYDPNAVVIIMTAYSSTESAVQALKYGAFDYLQKPFRVDELLATLRRGLASYPSRASSTAFIEIRDHAPVRSRNAM